MKETMDKNILALLDSKAFTVRVQYQLGTAEYSFVCNLPVKVGDYVIVPTAVRDNSATKFDGADRITVAKVMAVDTVVNIQPDSDIEYKWVIGVVDFTAYNATQERNKKIMTRLIEVNTQHVREQARDMVLNNLSMTERGEILALL